MQLIIPILAYCRLAQIKSQKIGKSLIIFFVMIKAKVVLIGNSKELFYQGDISYYFSYQVEIQPHQTVFTRLKVSSNAGDALLLSVS
jgi:hypothetical protein